MTAKKPLLSASLSELVERFKKEDVVAEMEKRYQSAPTRLIPTSSIDDNSFIAEVWMPKEVVDAFAEQLKTRGIYNPLVLKRKGERYELILGRKRLYGARSAGIISLPAVITEISEEEELLTLLADNRDQRESNILEMALVCHALQQRYGYSVNTLAGLSHQSRSQIANILRLLRLPSSLRSELSHGKLSYGHARAIACLEEGEALSIASKILEEGLSVRETERLVREVRNEEGDSGELRERFQEYHATMTQGKKDLRIHFETSEEKERFLSDFLQG